MKIAIRADGGHKIGYGHLSRTSVLARKFREEGHEIKYYTKKPEALERFLGKEFSKKEIKEEVDFLEILREEEITGVITDQYKIDTNIQKIIRKNCDGYIALSDDDKHKFCCDILVNGNIYAQKLDYKFKGDKPTFLLGEKFLPLKNHFRELSKKNISVSKNPEKVLITMGGSDTNDITPKIMSKLEERKITVDVIIGPGFENQDKISKLSKSLDTKFNLLNNPSNLAELMYEADFTITATGSTIYELIAVNTPFIGIPQTENQKKIAKELLNRDLALISENTKKLEKNIEKIESNSIRENFVKQFSGLIDGKGRERIFSNFCDHIK